METQAATLRLAVFPRSSLLTGRYNYRTGIVDTFQGRSLMHPDEVTLAPGDSALDRAAKEFLARQGVAADVTSVVVDDDSGVLFVRAKGPVDSHAMGEALKADVRAAGKVVEQVYWQFPPTERRPA